MKSNVWIDLVWNGSWSITEKSFECVDEEEEMLDERLSSYYGEYVGRSLDRDRILYEVDRDEMGIVLTSGTACLFSYLTSEGWDGWVREIESLLAGILDHTDSLWLNPSEDEIGATP